MQPVLEDLRAAHAQAPEDARVYAALRTALYEAEAFVELAELTERWAMRQLSPVEGARAFAEAAEWLEHAGRLERAQTLFMRALDLDPRQAIAANAVVRLGVTLRDAQSRIPVLERWLERLMSIGATAEERADAHLALARVQSLLPGRIEKSLAYYKDAFALDRELVVALDEAIGMARKARRARDVRALLEFAIDHTPDVAYRIWLLRELARERLAPPVEPQEAVEALDAALVLVPDDVEIRHELVSILMQRAGRTRGTPEGRADLSRAAKELVEIARRIPEEDALAFLELALELEPTHTEALTLYAAHPVVAADDKRYVTRALAYLARATDAAATLPVRRRLARLYADRGQRDPARKILDVPAARSDPDSSELALALALDDGRLVDAVLHARVAHADLTEQERKRALLGLLARASMRDDVDAMRLAAESILMLDPSDEMALRALLRVHEVTGSHAAQRAVLMRLTSVITEPTEQRKLYLDVAKISEGPLAEPDKAIEALYVVARANPSDADTRNALRARLHARGRTNEVGEILAWEATHLESTAARRAALEALLALDAETPIDPSQMVATLRAYRISDKGDVRAREALIAKLQPAGEAEEVAALHAESVAAATTDEERVRALTALADVREHGLQDLDGAWEAFSRLLDLAPTDTAAVARVVRIAERSALPARRIEASRRRARALPEEERIPVLVELAVALEQPETLDIGGAIDAYEEAYAIDPGARGVAEALYRLYSETDRHRDLSRLLEELAAAAPNDVMRMSYLRKRAHLLRDVLEDDAAAARVFATMRMIEEDDEALLAVIDVARRASAYRELASLLAIRIERADSMIERRTLSMERALLLLDHLGDNDAGKAELVRTRGIDGTFIPALERLALLQQSEGNFVELADTLEAELGLVGQPGEKAALARRLFELYTGLGANEQKALGALRAWVKATPFDIEALRELSVRLGEDPAEQVKVLETLAIELARRVEKGRREHSPSAEREADEVVSTLLLAASVASRTLEDIPRAEKHLRRALGIAFVSDSLTFALEQAAIELDLSMGANFRHFVVHELVSLARGAERPTKDELFLRAAGLAGGSLADGALAFYILRDAMPDVPGNEEVLAALVDFGTTSSLESELELVLAKRIEESIDAREAKALLRERTQILYTLERWGEAADQYLRLVAMEPEDERLRARHRECLGRAGRHQDLLLALDQAVRRAIPGSDHHVDLLREIASTWEGALENRFEAADAYRNLLKIRPGDREATAALERLVPRTRVGVDDLSSVARPSARPPKPPVPGSPSVMPAPAPVPEVEELEELEPEPEP